MKPLAIVFAIIAAYSVAQLLFSGYHFFLKSPQLTKQSFAGQTEHGNKTKPELKLFLAGDSVAAGVGASSFSTSMGGRIASALARENHVSFTNAAKSGNRMADVAAVPREKQDIIVLFIASNDLYHFTNLRKFENDTEAAMERYSKLAGKVIIIGPADIAGATAIPLIMKPLYNLRWQKYAAIMKTAASKHKNVTYVYPAEHKAKLRTYGHTEAKDGFHPNDNGHRFWADLVLSKIQQ
ncbi:hypothetical protein HYU20_02925 [Candidatus Woesearchaeota archaeon]|nr:hypothetical protein [Candidatus Woesearchaeota archaeon]